MKNTANKTGSPFPQWMAKGQKSHSASQNTEFFYDDGYGRENEYVYDNAAGQYVKRKRASAKSHC